MHTHWLVALLAGLLFFEAIRSLSKAESTLPRLSWTTSELLLGLSLIVSLFCLGLSWHYYTQSVSQEMRLGDDWLPYVVGLIVLCFLAGSIQSWRNRDDNQEVIEDPYYLLETSAKLTEAPLFETKRQRKLAITGGTLALSIIIGFIGAALILEVNDIEASAPFFAVDRARPTPQANTEASQVARLELATNVESGLQSEHNIAQHNAVQHSAGAGDPLDTDFRNDVQTANADEADAFAPSESMSDTLVRNVATTSQSGTGGPVSETALDALTDASPTFPTNAVALQWYSVIIRAELGAHAQPKPNMDQAPLAVLPRGNQYHATGRTTDGLWIRILLENIGESWILADAVGEEIIAPDQATAAIDILPVVKAE